MDKKLSITDLNLQGQKALIRVDFNVPMHNGEISDDTKIRLSLPTIQYALDHGAAIILLSHLGRPENGYDPKFSLTPCARKLSELLKLPVQMAPNCSGMEVDELAKNLKSGEILFLENLRFHPGEEHPEKEQAFVNSLANLGTVYINEAFGSSHRAHASTAILPQFFPGKAAAGFLLQKEIAYLSSTLLNPNRPFCAILGGSKISSKFELIKVLLKKADFLLIGGAMAYTFFKAEQISIGDSLYEPEFISSAREILDITSKTHSRIILPVDSVITKKENLSNLSSTSPFEIVSMKQGIPDGWVGVDIGPETIRLFDRELQKAKTIFWNGPVGIFEKPPFDQGTLALAKSLAQLTSATTIVGGGDSIAAIHAAGVEDKIGHLSTGGGASLEYIEYGHLPGIDALSNKV
jgi:3-phosphoglycerate kinase